MADFSDTIRQVQDTSTVMAGIQARQAEALKGHGEWLASQELSLRQSHERMTHLEVTLVEIGDKLHALIDIVDGWKRKPQ